MNETALKERIRAIAKGKGINFNEVWKQLLLERFLARLSRSKHHEHFIFKGGMLLAQRIEIGRETTDLDFLMTRLKSEAPAIEAALRDIISQTRAARRRFLSVWVNHPNFPAPVGNDRGFVFIINGVSPAIYPL